MEAWAFPRHEMQAQPHRIGNGKNVGEQDGRIQRVAAQRLQGDLTGQLGVAAQAHEIAGFCTGLQVLRQIAPRLPHHPDRRAVDWLTRQGTQETVILERGSR